MRIQDMFERDINRNINGVIKVGQDDEANVEQELQEYVVTNELRRHYSTFFEAYDRALDVPTDKIGVWISGFFGSGKSHFLKMLYYVLTNQTASDGRTAAQVLGPRFDDPMIEANANRAASIPTEAILFNIDSKGPSNKDKTAVMRVFARVFYENQGFYGADLKLARLERYVDQKGLTSAFRAAYEDATGVSWVEDRENYEFNTDELAEALDTAGVMSADAAIRWIEGSEDAEFSIEQLTDEIRDYAEARARENGGQFRLLFMIDEMSQYVSNDVNLLLNLQTIVEELGTKCAGRVWVMVTGQEAIDEITKVAGDDFSKILGRFNTRLSLSSSGAGEVIRKRVLAKKADSANLLKEEYAQNATVLRNLFTFKNATQDLGSYEDEQDFAEAFPFVGYQFRLMQDVINELRKQGSSGKHLSAERSMLSGFQEAAQHVEEKDENALVPLWRFYDTVRNFLEGRHTRVITNCVEAAEKSKGLEPQDAEVLKLLFLLRWVEREMPSDIENVTTLMTSDVRTDRAALRAEVQESLDRLMRQNYIERTGELYRFLTDDEQEIALQIERTKVDVSTLTKNAAAIVFDEILASKKLAVGKNQFPLTEILDQTYVSNVTSGGIVLRVITGIDGSGEPSHEELVMKSTGEAIVVLASEVGYYDCLSRAAKIEQFINTFNRQNLPQSQQQILRNKQQEKTELTKQAKALMEEAILHGKYYVQGSVVSGPQSQSAKKVLEDCASQLVGSIYQKLAYIEKNYDSDADIRQILNGTAPLGFDGAVPNSRAVEEVSIYLTLLDSKHAAANMQEPQDHFQKPPYGWAEVDIAAAVAELLAQKKAKLEYAGKAVDPQEARVVELLRKRQRAEKTVVRARHAVDPATMSVARAAIEEFANVHDLPLEEDDLAQAIRKQLEAKQSELSDLLTGEYKRNPNYPGYGEVVEAKKLVEQIIADGTDSADLIAAVSRKRDDLADAAEDLGDVADFFPNQQKIFDRACELREKLREDRGYLAADETATQAFETIDDYLATPRLGRSYQKLGNANVALSEAHGTMLAAKRDELLAQLDSVYESVDAFAEEKGVTLTEIGQAKIARRGSINDATTLTKLDSLTTKINQDQASLYAKIEREHERKNAAKPANTRVTVTTHLGGGAQPMPHTPAPVPTPKPKVRTVSRTTVFTPRSLASEAEIDEYLNRARTELLKNLSGNDAIRLS